VLQSIEKKFIISLLILLLAMISKSFASTINNINAENGIIIKENVDETKTFSFSCF